MKMHIKGKTKLIHVFFSFIFFIVFSNSYAANENKTLQPSQKLGLVPVLSEHYKTKPSHYDFNTMPIDQKSNTVGLRFVMGTKTTMIRWYLKKSGTKLSLHFHPNEQINFVEQGQVEVHSQGETYLLSKGQVMIFPPNVPHEFVARQDNTIMVDIQTPARQEFINGEFDKIAQQIFK